MDQRRAGRKQGIPHAICSGGAPTMTRLAWLCCLLWLPVHGETPPFPQRVQFVIEAYAHPKSSGALGYANIAAKLRLHEDSALCSRRLEELLAEPRSFKC